jgi:prolyl oligopeptidase
MKLNQLLLVGGMVLSGTAYPQTEKILYPVAEKQAVTDTYFGFEVTDPYRWLEDDATQKVTDWVKAENQITQDYLNQIPFRDQLKQRFTDMVNYEKIETMVKRHGKYYFLKNEGTQNQSVLYTKETIDGEASVLLDPNTFSDNGTIALSGISFSNNGKYMAYLISRNGSDRTEIYVMDLATRQLTNDHIQRTKFTEVNWLGDGFYYCAFGTPDEGQDFSNTNHKIYYHKLGDDQSKDQVFYENTENSNCLYRVAVSSDEQVLLIFESGKTEKNRSFIQHLNKPNAPFIEIGEPDYAYNPVHLTEDTIYFHTNYKAPNYKLVKANIHSLELEAWKDVVPESENALSYVRFANGHLISVYNKDASNHAYVYSLDGTLKHEVKLPTLGSVDFIVDKDDKEVFYTFSSFTFPTTSYKYDIESNKSELYIAQKVQLDTDDFVTEQVFYPSRDSTKIPMFLTYKKGLKLDGNNPVYLYGYGGFGISLRPEFSPMRIPFLENGGIYAQANLRGGGEYGANWYQAGMKINKQNTFDDFIAAAEYLIEKKYTNNQKIAIVGGSNGGLLVSVCVNQRPDLFRVAVPQVGVMDMLRHHKFTIGYNYSNDYGISEESKEMFKYLYGYSPLHNIKNDGTPYPAILVTTADHDDRAVPAHSYKYAATLQASYTGDAPKLIRIETEAGHGGGKPLYKIIQEQTDIYSFIMYNLGMELK